MYGDPEFSKLPYEDQKILSDAYDKVTKEWGWRDFFIIFMIMALYFPITAVPFQIWLWNKLFWHYKDTMQQMTGFNIVELLGGWGLGTGFLLNGFKWGRKRANSIKIKV